MARLWLTRKWAVGAALVLLIAVVAYTDVYEVRMAALLIFGFITGFLIAHSAAIVTGFDGQRRVGNG